jgi:hypothetical protein
MTDPTTAAPVPLPDTGQPTDARQLAEAVTSVQSLSALLAEERTARQQAETQAQRTAAESARLQHVTEVATRYHLPPELSQRLQGSTLAEIEADAKAVLKALGRLPTAPAAPGSPSVPRTATGLVSDPTPPSRARQLLERVNGSPNPHPFLGSGED